MEHLWEKLAKSETTDVLMFGHAMNRCRGEQSRNHIRWESSMELNFAAMSTSAMEFYCLTVHVQQL